MLEPFAEACLQGSVNRTAAVLGSEPQWQEHLHLPYSPITGAALTSSAVAEVSLKLGILAQGSRGQICRHVMMHCNDCITEAGDAQGFCDLLMHNGMVHKKHRCDPDCIRTLPACVEHPSRAQSLISCNSGIVLCLQQQGAASFALS